MMVATNPHKVNFHDDVFYVSDSPGENTIIVEFKNHSHSSVNSDLIKTIAIPVLDLIYYTEFPSSEIVVGVAKLGGDHPNRRL
jgi:hypothetical protein